DHLGRALVAVAGGARLVDHPQGTVCEPRATMALSTSPSLAKNGSERAAPNALTSSISPTSQRAVSRSWIVTSTKSPPESRTEEIGGGDMSRSDVRKR